jgi:hypothetical protein
VKIAYTKFEIIIFKGQKYILEAALRLIVLVLFRNEDGSLSYLIQSFGAFQLNDISGGYGSYEVLRKVSKG